METITLGKHEVAVVGQSLPYLEDKLGSEFLSELGSKALELDEREVLTFVQGRAYEVLSVLIPEVEQKIPRHEFEGYLSRDAYEAKDKSKRDYDAAPTIPQIVGAFKAAYKVCDVDFFGGAKWVIELLGLDDEEGREQFRARIKEAFSEQSSTSPSTNGGSVSKKRSGRARTSPKKGA